MSNITHDQDFHAWTREQAALLRTGQFTALDLDHLIEELESMGAREQRELTGRLKVLLAHLLKWQFQSQRRSAGWEATIREERLSLEDLLDHKPGLRLTLPAQIVRAYRLARLLAVTETNLAESTFPATCPYAPAQVIDPDFYPG